MQNQGHEDCRNNRRLASISLLLEVELNCIWCLYIYIYIYIYLRTGVSSVEIQGSDNDQLVVSGQDVDSVKLTRSLRKKLCYATILTVEEVKEKDADTTEEQVEPKFPACNYQLYHQPYPKYYEVVYDPYQNNCSIL
jgi:hypothetical protein